MATEVTKTSSNKGGECVIVNGYKFCKGYLKENNSKIVWRCSIRNCPAVLVTNIDPTTVVSTTGSHSHPPVTGIPSAAHRTTNGAESFNRHFSSQFNSPHPTFYVFWDVLVKQQTVAYTIANSLTNMAPITSFEKSKLNFIQRQWQRYSGAAITRLQYLKSLGYRFSAVTS